MKKYLSLAFLVAGVSLLAACGDDDSSSAEETKTSSGPASVETFDDLAHCTKSHYGEIVFVEEEGTYFECTSEDWVEVDSAKVDSLLAASSSSEGTSEEAKSSSSVKADSAEVAKVETKKVDSVAVSGFAQKGPFASGTAVTVFGLDSALEMTKTKFTGKVSGDSGAFKVEKIVLPSQFALVQASGFYANEVTGKNTSGTKTTLNAIVDLSEGKNVKANVNLFTELEYARVKHLVLKENFNVPAAKKRATKELLAVFGAKGSEDLTATSLSIADTGAAGKALLAASILLQGDLSVSKFGLRLGEVGDLFASTGSLNSDTLRAELADWASKIDSVDNFKSIRTNVKNMKLVATVPDFESVIYAFWTGVYKLGACTDSLEETIKKNENKLSDNYGVGYACTSKRWHKSTALDTDLGLCTAKKEGSFEERKQEKKDTEYYVCKSGTWNKITATQFELKECTEKRENEYVTAKSGEYFVCSGKQWKTIDSVTYELKLCTESRNNKVEITKKGEYYKCVSGEWENSDKLSYELQGAGACTDKNNLDTYKTESLGTYVCDNKEWRKAGELEVKLGVCGDENNENKSFKQDGEKYYVCLEKEWNETDEASFVLKKICTESLENPRVILKDTYYVCDDKNGEWAWRKVSALEYELGDCSSLNKNTFVKSEDGSYYACDGDDWGVATEKSYTFKSICDENHKIDTLTYGGEKYYCNNPNGGSYDWQDFKLVDSRDGTIRTYKLVRIGNQIWMAENLNLRYIEKTDGGKVHDTSSYVGSYGRLYIWSAAMDSVGKFKKTGETANGCGYRKLCSATEPVRGICPEGWHLPSIEEVRTLIVVADTGISSYSSSNNAGISLKAVSDWPEPSEVCTQYVGKDTYGFAAKPDGNVIMESYGGEWYLYNEHDKTYAEFWTSTDSELASGYAAWAFVMLGCRQDVDTQYDANKARARSIRCILD